MCQYFTKLFQMYKTQVKITTYSAYEKTILHKVIPYFDKHLPKIRLDAVSANTVKQRHANIHKAFAYAYKTDLIQSNPADKVELPKIEKYSGQFYNQKQIENLIRVVKGDPIE